LPATSSLQNRLILSAAGQLSLSQVNRKGTVSCN
jgi:hypothetical protein